MGLVEKLKDEKKHMCPSLGSPVLMPDTVLSMLHRYEKDLLVARNIPLRVRFILGQRVS